MTTINNLVVSKTFISQHNRLLMVNVSNSILKTGGNNLLCKQWDCTAFVECNDDHLFSLSTNDTKKNKKQKQNHLKTILKQMDNSSQNCYDHYSEMTRGERKNCSSLLLWLTSHLKNKWNLTVSASVNIFNYFRTFREITPVYQN